MKFLTPGQYDNIFHFESFHGSKELPVLVENSGSIVRLKFSDEDGLTAFYFNIEQLENLQKNINAMIKAIDTSLLKSKEKLGKVMTAKELREQE